MLFRQFLNDASACASYLLGCPSKGRWAVVDPHADLVGDYIRTAEVQGVPIVAVLETHVQADHLSGLPSLVEQTGATAYLPEGAGVEFEHVPLADGDVLELGNTKLRAIATPGHATAHHAYLVTDRRRADEPWLVLTGDALLVGDAGRPDLHAHGEQTVEEMGRALYRSLTGRLLALPDHLLLYPAHYSGSVCGRGLSGNPASTVGFERRHNRALRHDSEDAFVDAMVGLERSTLPLIGESEFGLASSAAVLSFIVAFGLAKSFTNLAAGAGAERLGRRRLLILGWGAALPVPLLIAVAPSWAWIVAANVLLGVNQGLAWSMTVVMKIDLVGPQRRGFALGLNEAAGYGGGAIAPVLT